MDVLFGIDDRDGLQRWAGGRGRSRRSGVEPLAATVQGLRFAFWGRTSTAEYQDPVTSRVWQREVSATLVADTGRSLRSSTTWAARGGFVGPASTGGGAVGAGEGAERSFDAVVVGEFERAFTDGQFVHIPGFLGRHGVGVWLPEAGGPVDLDASAHRALMQVLAAQSQRAVVRSRHRTMAAMTAQTIEQGRYLGGRPPYGDRLVDANSHPNRAHAAWGRRCRRLDPDPVTAPHVRWMFAERLNGRSVAGIARELNERGVPCPSAADRERNRHRSGQVWT